MGSTSLKEKNDTVRLILQEHPFRSEKREEVVARKSFRELFETVNTSLPIENAIFIDGEKRVYNPDTIPTSDLIAIKMVPAGTSTEANRAIGSVQKVAGAALIVLGILVTVGTLGGGVAVGAGLIVSGATTLAGGVVTFFTEVPELTPQKKTQNTPSISGSKNRTVLDGRVPLLLGRHLITPNNAANPYTTLPTVEAGAVRTPTLHQLFCVGYNDVHVDTSTFRIGNTNYDKFSSNPPEVHRDGSSHTNYPFRVKQETVNAELEFKNIPTKGTTIREENLTTGEVDTFIDQSGALTQNILDAGGSISRKPPQYSQHRVFTIASYAADPSSVQRTSPTGTKTITVGIECPRGLVAKNNKGESRDRTVSFSVKIRNHSPDPFPPSTTTGLLVNQPYTVGSGWAKNDVWRNEYEFSIPTSSNPTQQYDVLVYRTSPSSNDSKISDETYFSYVKYGAFSTISGVENRRPILEDTQSKLTTVSVSIDSSKTANNVIDEFNMICQLHTWNYSGSGSGSAQWAIEATNNPASAAMYILRSPNINQHPVTETQIDWASFEEWWVFCDRGGAPEGQPAEPSFECNAVLDADITVKSALDSICMSGRASWSLIEGKYSIIVDSYKPNPVQMITPRNSRNFKGAKAFNTVPTVIKMQIIDASANYIAAEVPVYASGIVDPSVSSSANAFGVTNALQAQKLGRYQHAVARLRPETFTFDIDVEYLLARRGDRILFTHDVPLIGLSSGRISVVETSSGNTTGFFSDDEIHYTPGKTYTVRVRTSSEILSYPVNNLGGTSHEIIFSTPITGEDVINEDDLFIFGESGEETLDLIVTNITVKENLSATVTGVPYAPEIFNDTVPIPEYKPIVSTPSESGVGGILDGITNTQTRLEFLETQQQINAGNVERAGSAITANRPDAFEIGGASVSLAICENNEVVMLNREDSKFYKTRITDKFAPTKVGDTIGAHPSSAGTDTSGISRFLYVNRDDGDRVYIKKISEAGSGTRVTTEAGYYPQYMSNEEFVYVDVLGNMHRSVVTDNIDGVEIISFPIFDFALRDSLSVYYSNPEDGNKIYLKNLSDNDRGVKVVDSTASNITYSTFSGGTLSYINFDEELDIYTKSVDEDTLGPGFPAFNTALSFSMNAKGDVSFISLLDGNKVFSGLQVRAVESAVLEADSQEYTFTGDLVQGSNRITNLVFQEVNGVQQAITDLVAGDTLYNGILIDGKANITFRGANYLTIDSVASSNFTGAIIQAVGSRLILDANRVIIPGTVTTNLLEANAITSDKIQAGAITSEKLSSSAINSVQTTPSGPKTEIDLDSGTYKFRKANGDVIFDFDANRTNSELMLSGDLDVTSDDESRHIQVGSQGLRAQDSGNRVIHDLPQSLSTSQLSYLGHTYWFSADSSFPDGALRLFLGSSLSGALPPFTTLDPFTWTTVNSVTAGNTNVRGVVIYVEFNLTTTWSNYSLTSSMPQHLSRHLSFRPQGTNWGVFSSSGGYPVPTIQASGSGFWDKDATGFGQNSEIISARASQQMILPTNSSGQFQFNAEFSEEVPPNIYYEQAGVTIFQLGLIM